MKKALYLLIIPVAVIFIYAVTDHTNYGSIYRSPLATPGTLPNPHLTPGAINPDITQANIQSTICNPNWTTKSIRPPVSYTNPLKVQQITQYGYTDTSLATYEEDHLIALTDGGNPTDPHNLWPEAYPLAKEKDKYEMYVHKQICTGAITLAEGQHRLATDWYGNYVAAGLNKAILGAAGSTVDLDDEPVDIVNASAK